jgi:hypothetical protein
MDLQGHKLRVKRKIKYGAGEAYGVEVRTPRGWCQIKEFSSHEAVRWWLTIKKIPVDNSNLQA